jgi:DNA-binding transcriptional regulator YhcF (GntR family)
MEFLDNNNMSQEDKFEVLEQEFIDTFPEIITKAVENNLAESETAENYKKANEQVVKALLEQGLAKEQINKLCK